MSTERELYQDDALYLLFLRNDFYRRKFHQVLFIFLLSLFVIGTLCYAIYFLLKNPPHPLYFVTDERGRLLLDPPVTVGNMPREEIMKWTVQAVEAAYSYDFVNYRTQLQSAQKYFTDYGWQNYMQGLTASSNLLALTQRSYVVIAKVAGPLKLLNENLLGGAYAWKFEVPLLVTYLPPPYDGKGSFQNPLVLTVIVQRQSLLTSYKGLGVIQMTAKLAINTPGSAVDED